MTAGIEVFRDVKESLHDLLRAKTIQDLALSSPLQEDRRVEFEVHYQAREIIGGDFYRIERQDADRYAVLVADAMGHGVPAALYTMQLRSLWDDHRDDLQSPARFLGLLARGLHALVHDAGFFATAVCLSYDAANGEVRCVRAGHPAPLWFRPDGSCETVGRAQLALGMKPEVSYEETTAQLAPGDALLLFTDGAMKLFDRADKEMGITGLERLMRTVQQGLAPNSFHLDKIEEMLLRFTDQIHLPDDLTLLKLWRKG